MSGHVSKWNEGPLLNPNNTVHDPRQPVSLLGGQHRIQQTLASVPIIPIFVDEELQNDPVVAPTMATTTTGTIFSHHCIPHQHNIGHIQCITSLVSLPLLIIIAFCLLFVVYS